MAWHPPKRKCVVMDYHRMLLKTDKSYRKKRLEIEDYYQNYFRRNQRKALRDIIIKIPVVVHVVCNNSEQNISDEQIKTQIDVLNKDFRKQNVDINKVPDAFSNLATDSRIEFQLACRDPDGNSTNGITRTNTSIDGFIFDGGPEPIKSTIDGGINPWPADKYLNIWVCKLDDGLLGYATFPAADVSKNDGVVIGYSYFGTMETATYPYDKGRTTTHEVGHWLNLLHIWGDDRARCDGSDNVDDTPNQAGSNYGKPVFPHVSCSNEPDGDLFMNFMDYVDDDSMMMFTPGQAERAEATLYGFRSSILTSDGCIPIKKTQEFIQMTTAEKGECTTKMFNGCEWI